MGSWKAKTETSYRVLGQSWQTFYVKDQIVNPLAFVVHRVFASVTQLWHHKKQLWTINNWMSVTIFEWTFIRSQICGHWDLIITCNKIFFMVFVTVKIFLKFFKKFKKILLKSIIIFMDFYGLYRNRWQAGFDLQTVVCQLL